MFLVLGVLLGLSVSVFPGRGGSVVDWIAHGHTVQSARDKSRIGSGDVRGVIGPESSNNAKEGGGLVPTLILGIPGSGSMAVFLGGLALLGYDAGPPLITNNLDITYTVVCSLALANVVGAGLCIALSGGIAKLTTIRFTLLAQFLFMMISFAAFQSRQTPWDLVALFAIGLLGIFLRRFDWSRPEVLIGFVLSNQAENFSNMANQVAGARFRRGFEQGFEYIASPTVIVILILILTVISVVVGIRRAKQILLEDRETLSEVLIAAVGAGNPRNIDGLGGGNAVTTKVAMLSRSGESKADIDFFFAEVPVEERLVDYGPTCGNTLVGVDPAAIEMGLGAGEAGAGPACRALLATTLPARGAFAGDPFNLNVAGGYSSDTARDCFAEADLIVAVGCSLASNGSGAGRLWPGAEVPHLDIAPRASARAGWQRRSSCAPTRGSAPRRWPKRWPRARRTGARMRWPRASATRRPTARRARSRPGCMTRARWLPRLRRRSRLAGKW